MEVTQPDLGSFLFGNVDDQGILEKNEFWDEEITSALSGWNLNFLKEQPIRKYSGPQPTAGRVVFTDRVAAALTREEERFIEKAQATAEEVADDFSMFDAQPAVEILRAPFRMPERLLYKNRQSSRLKFTELYLEEKRKKGRTVIDFVNKVSIDDAETVYAPDQRCFFEQMKVKYHQRAPTHFKLPLAQDNGVGHIPFCSPLSGAHSSDLSPVDLCNWENDVIWDAGEHQSCPAPSALLDSNIHWQDEAIVWDDTVPVSIPIPEVIVDPQLPGLHMVSKKQLKTVSAKPSLNVNGAIGRTVLSVRKRPNTSMLCHSPPAQQLSLVYWQMNDVQAREFHRPRHKLPNSPVSIELLREARLLRQLSRGIQTPADLSASDNLIVLLEYTEQHPPVVQNVGMVSKLCNYYNQKSADDVAYDYPEGMIGENVSLSPSDTSPFLGRIPPGERMYGIENRLFKAALFQHSPPSTDFLLLRTLSGQWVLRSIPHLFTVGQILPLRAVPSPSSKTAMAYARNRLKCFIHQTLRNEQTIMLNNVKAVFPNETEPAIRSVLKECCTFQRKGNTGQCWTMKPKAELASEATLKAICTAEDVCLNETSQAALVRLRDMGIVRFNNPYALTEASEAVDNEEAKRTLGIIKQEIQLMPWNVSSTFCDVMRGRLKLSVNTTESDMNDQFAFAKTRTDSRVIRDSREEKPGRLADGSDLRKVNLPNAKKFLLKCGVPQTEINIMKRWRIIDLMRNKATEMAEDGNQDPEVLKYARPTIVNRNVRQKEFDNRAQYIFDRMVSYCQGSGAGEDDPEIDLFEQELEALLDTIPAAEPQSSIDPEEATGNRKRTRQKGGPAKRKKIVVQEEDPNGELEALESILTAQQLRHNQDLGVVVGTLGPAAPITSGKIVRKTSTIYNEDAIIQKVEYIRDAEQILYYIRKKRNLEQKRSNIGTMMDESQPQDDQFFAALFEHSTDRLAELREACNIKKPKKAHLGDVAATENSDQHLAWLMTSLFISIPSLETDPSNPTTLDTPSVRCGKHAPIYRSYVWRKDHWTLLNADVALLLQQIKPQALSWCCQHREQAGGPICGARYTNTLECIRNKSFLRQLTALAQEIGEKLETGYFLPEGYLEKNLDSHL